MTEKNISIFKFIYYKLLYIASLGLYVHDDIKPEPKFHPNSLKGKVAKYTNIMWAVIFASFGIVIFVAMFDSFPINRPILVKVLTRLALGLLVLIFIIDGVVGLFKDNDVEKS